MIKKLILLVLTLSSFSAGIHAENLTFCPKGFFSTESGNIVFEAKKWSSDYMLKLPKEEYIQFSGPIFPGYKLAHGSKVKVDSEEKEVIAIQECKTNGALVTKDFKLVNGGILSKISYDNKGDKFKKAVKYRIFLPLKTFAGKSCIYSGGKLDLPKEKTKRYILLSRKGNDELRFQVSSELEVGIKFISGVKSYVIADCRHHGKPESHFHLHLDMEGNTLEYFLCLLSPGQPFPAMVKNTESKVAAKIEKSNLLHAGADFEIGPNGCHPFCFYSWNESWTTPGIMPSFDDTEKYQGRYSLKLTAENYKKKLGRFNYNKVLFTPVKLDPNKTYTLSAWMKSDTDAMKVIMSAIEPWRNTISRRILVGEKWQRYSWTFKPEKFKLLNYRQVSIGIDQHVIRGSLWVDNVQLEEGGIGKYKATPLEFGTNIDKPYKLFSTTELAKAAIKLYFRNNTSRAADFKINYAIKDYWDKEVAKGHVSEKVKADGNAMRIVKIPSLPTGYYRVNFNSSDGKFHDEAIFGIYQEMNYKGFLPLDWPLGCHASEGNPIVRKLGFGWSRCWNFVFKDICPEKGKFEFAKTDIIVKRCKESKLNLMPILGPSFRRASYHKKENVFVPEWSIARKSKVIKKDSWDGEVSYPEISAWKSYIKAVVSRYKNSIKAWEILNEPNCWLTPEEYVPYLKAAYEAAKEADPDCIIVGVCATSDWGKEPAPWTKRVLEIDGCQSLDVLSIHMYSNTSPESYKTKGSDGMLKYLKELLKSFGRDIPIWHTEKSHNTTVTGYSSKKNNLPGIYMLEPGFRVPDFRNKAEYMIRETLIDSAVGKGPNYWFGALSNDIYIMPNSNPYGLHHTEYDGSPCPELIAANGLARMLEGRNKPQELIKLGSSLYCSLYQGEKGTLAAIWDAENKTAINIKAGKISFNVYNMFGAALPYAKTLKISSAPIFLTFDGRKAPEIKAILLRSEISGEKFTFSGGFEQNDGKAGIGVYLFNKAIKDLKTQVALNKIPASWKLGKNNIALQCKTNRYSRAFFPVSLPASSSVPAQIKVSADKHNSTLSLIPYSSLDNLKAMLADTNKAEAFKVEILTIDGELSDWNDAGLCGAATAEKVKNGRKSWRDMLNLSAGVRFRYDEEYLYLAAKVYDNVVERNAPAEKAYSSDCIELLIGLDPSSRTAALKSKKVNKTGKYDYQLLFAPGMGSGKYPEATAWNCKLKTGSGIKTAYKIFKYGYTIEAAIPWKTLKKDFKAEKGTKLIMTFQIKDSDIKNEPARRAIFWTGDDANWMCPQNWGYLILQ